MDSGSSDGSVEMAKALEVEVVELDRNIPFTAARARNEGFRRLRELHPNVELVQFVDGDCEVAAGWLQTAATILDQRRDVAVVCGRRRERYPKASVYNRLCDVEWNTPVGEANACGGDAMMRTDAFANMGGYNSAVVAGEEPELCMRLQKAGWKVIRADAEMTLHDAAMARFWQWWKRAVRGGYGGTDIAVGFERGVGDFSCQMRSARYWAIGWPAVVVLLTGATLALGGWRAAGVAAALALAILPAQMARVALKARRRAGDIKTALEYGCFTMLSKWAHLQGQFRYWRDRRSGRHLSLIEYKQVIKREAEISL